MPFHEHAGTPVADGARLLGFTTRVEQDRKTRDWTCYCTKAIVAALETVVEIEEQLDRLGKAVGGHVDGFGSFGNGAHS